MVYKFRNVHTHQALPIPPGEHLIGREDDCEVHIDDSSVSRRHAQIFNTEEGVFIQDLGSSNGTAIHGKLITGRTALPLNEVVYFGTTCYRLEPEVVGEELPAQTAIPHTTLKPAGLHSAASLHKATDRVPLASIRFDSRPATDPTEIAPATQEKLTRPTTPLPHRSISSPAESTVVPPAATPVLTANAFSAEVPEPQPCPPWRLTVIMTFGAGMVVGVLAGIAIARYLMALPR